MSPLLEPEKQQSEPCCPRQSCCAGKKSQADHYITGWIYTEVGRIPQIATSLSRIDMWEHFKVRLGIGRMNYKVTSGLYAVGSPSAHSPVLVSANYKLSFDALRKEAKGLAAWIMVLDTQGINVWCAAGKGTFGTRELIDRIEKTKINKITNHKKLVVPQLGAPGVSAHQVKKLSGFTVIFGPVRAKDLPAFLENNLKATPGMRRVRFTTSDRLLLVPVEWMHGFRYLVLIGFAFFLISGLSKSGYSISSLSHTGIRAVLNLLLTYTGAMILGLVLLPWLPGRRFSFKGFYLGIILFVLSYTLNLSGTGILEPLAWLLLMTALSSFIVMNLTGSTHYTSLSGVKKEMRFALPMQIMIAIPGALLWIISRFF